MPEETRKSNKRLSNAFADTKQHQCQFLGISEKTHEYEENYYCLLHLPYEVKKDRGLNQAANSEFRDYIRKGETNFNFICLEGAIFSLSSNKYYSFIGAWLWTLSVHDTAIECLDISYSKIQGINTISKSTINRFYLKHCEIGSHIELNNNNFHLMLFEYNYFNVNKKDIRFDVVNYGLIINQGNIDAARFIDNKFDIAVKIAKSKIKTLEFIGNKFFVCPIFFKGEFGGISELVLPELKDYDFSKMPLKKGDRYWEDQYRKFREIYNIAKMREMYLEQSSYFTLMQHCIQKTNKIPKSLRWVSYLYGAISDYGQSVSRPLGWLLGLFVVSACFFWMLGVEKSNAVYLSLTQIKPYSILYEDEPRKLLANLCETKAQNNSTMEFTSIFFLGETKNIEKCDSLVQYKNGWFFAVWSILESTVYIILLTCIGLALRWNFRKA